MKPFIFILTTLCVFIPSIAFSQSAALEPNKDSPEQVQQLLPNQVAFLNLPEEKRNEFLKHIREADRLFQQQRIFECIEETFNAQKIFEDSPEIYNLRGSCYVEMRAFDKALDQFKKAASLASNNQSILFNLGEVYFVTEQWQKAIEAFESVQKILPPQNTALGHLIEFKIMLCKLKLGKTEEFVILANKYDYRDDTPYYYYANAALAYEDGDLLEAEKWMARAGRVFRNPNILAPWQDTLVEYGYIKSFYGEDLPASILPE